MFAPRLPIIDQTVNDVQLALEEADRKAARTNPPIHETSPTACLILGLLIEDMQYVDRISGHVLLMTLFADDVSSTSWTVTTLSRPAYSRISKTNGSSVSAI